VQHDHWLRVAANLKVDRARGPAPHKPLLLLVVAGLAEEGRLAELVLLLTGELTFRFLAFWTVVARRRPQRPDIRLPFFHLHSDRCWIPLDAAGQATTERRRAVAAQLDPDLHGCLQVAEFRTEFCRVLITQHFPDPGERAALCDLAGLAVPSDDVAKADAELYAETRERGREARFRLTVVPAYEYSCALTGYRCTTVGAGSIVDAAHIHRFRDSRNNDPRNGLALCKNAHWLFDQGLWSLADDYRVLVAASRFAEAGPDAHLLKRLEGQTIRLPPNPELGPASQYLSWHRQHVLGRPA
jgi:putative restriction endonuclease